MIFNVLQNHLLNQSVHHHVNLKNKILVHNLILLNLLDIIQ